MERIPEHEKHSNDLFYGGVYNKDCKKERGDIDNDPYVINKSDWGTILHGRLRRKKGASKGGDLKDAACVEEGGEGLPSDLASDVS